MIEVESLNIDDMVIYQDDTMYHFTSDAVLLSHFASVKKGDKVADFCSGSGIVGINLFALNREKIESVDLFEMQEGLCNLSKMSIEKNRLSDKIFAKNVKIQDINNKFYGKYSLITCNPPYMEIDDGVGQERYEIAVCRKEIEIKLSEIVEKASKCLKYGGRLAMCHRVDRLAEVINTFTKYKIEPKKLQFIISGDNKEPYLFLIEGVLGGKSGLKVLETVKN